FPTWANPAALQQLFRAQLRLKPSNLLHNLAHHPTGHLSLGHTNVKPQHHANHPVGGHHHHK
ncbi:MAG TPA: hypothetical protein VGZ22_01900, partial [Isosphaeraceae bacterium]|nr:hypothetical protein [Isosphaeraceae bacterium]